MKELRFITAKLDNGGGTTTRDAVEVLVPGHALLGPATFPELRPKLAPGEKSRRLRDGWVITPKGSK